MDFLNTSHIKYALTENPIIYVSFIQQFWQTAATNTLDTREDSNGISTLPNTEIFKQLALMGTAFAKLIMKVKKLEKIVKSNKARGRAKIIVSDDEEAAEDSSKQERAIDEIDQDPDIYLVQHDAEVQGRHE
nr:hypothetical protein [Tanacetum cinerariifolium]